MIKKNIFASRKSSVKSIFKNEDVFYSDYIPENVECRESQTDDLKYHLTPILDNKKAPSVLLSGTPGTGKTLLSKYVVLQLINYTTKAKFLYINAIQDNTRFAILSKIASLFKLPLPRRGLAIDEIFDRIKESLFKNNFIPIIIIDEIDQLKAKDCSDLLYDLSRINEFNKYFCLVLITNNKEFIFNLESRTQSSLFLNNIEFDKYTPFELKKILNQRIEYGLIDNAIDPDLIGFIAGFASKRGGDARIAIDLIYKSAKACERKGLLNITKEIILESSKLIDSVKLNEKVSFLSKEEIIVLNTLEDGITTSQLYELLDVPQRSIRRYLENLEKINLIRFEDISSNKGRIRKIFLNFDKSLI